MNRNPNITFPTPVLPKGSSTLQSAEAAPIVNRSGVSFPVISAFPHATSSYVINQEISSLQGMTSNDPANQVYAPILPTKQGNSNYLQHRQPQKPCKRPRRYACQYAGCDRSFDSQWSLERWVLCTLVTYRHVRIHTGEKPFTCSYPNCGKSFADKCALKRHEMSHNPSKPFKCTFPKCDKSFKTKSYLGSLVCRCSLLEIHMRLHTEDDPYKCTYKGCNRSFSSPKSLKHHEAVWHNAAGNEPSVEHDLREKIIRLQNRYRVCEHRFYKG